jgi:hypothetical protein
MYLWKFEIILHSGTEIVGYDKNDFSNSHDVADKFIAGNPNDIISLGDGKGTAQILVRKNEIAVMTISAG